MAEWVLAALLADAKEIPHYRDTQREATWASPHIREIAGSTVLLVGYGSIAEAVEALLAPFAAEIVRVGRRARDDYVRAESDLPELLPDADAVVMLTPLTGATKGMVDSRFLSAMRDGAVLINAARGPVVDSDALLHELRKERIRAVVDVTDPEPLPDGHPLWSAPGLLVTPHIAGFSDHWRDRSFGFVRSQLLRYVKGEPLQNVIGGQY